MGPTIRAYHRALAAGVVLAATLPAAAAAGSISGAADARSGVVAGCSDPAASRTGASRTATRAPGDDPTRWLDACGVAFYRDPAAPAAARRAAAATVGEQAAPYPLTDTFTLESLPGSQRTIYLDFNGGTVPSSAWSPLPISVRPYSADATVSTAFSDAELTEVQRAWQAIAEDYAPFDVNVTTKDPGLAAIDRTDEDDQVYGAHLYVTDSIAEEPCTCGGVAYVDVFNLSGPNHMYYQPAWVFTDGSGVSGKAISDAGSHEVGHQLGLSHDGTTTSDYYDGADPWAPIMGAGYEQPVVQWSQGEYGAADNQQDDLAIIAAGAPVRTDDHGGTTATASALIPAAPAEGVISTRTDTDAFTFTAAGTTTITVTTAAFANLDAQLTITAADGTPVATVNPAVSRVDQQTADGLGATWTATLPAMGGSYTATVDGVGTGSPATAGQYSDYGSLGRYEISLATQDPIAPVSFTTARRLPDGRVGDAYRGSVRVRGGIPEYSWQRTSGSLPRGTTSRLRADQMAMLLRGTPTRAGRYVFTLRVVDGTGTSRQRTFVLVVAPR